MAVYIPIISEFKDKGVKDATKEIESFSGKVKNQLGGIIKTAAKVTAAIGGIGIGAAVALKPAIDAAADLEEEISKSRVLFGEASDAVEDFASKAAKALGQSKKEALEAAGTFAIFGKSAGLTGGDLVGFSTEFTTLASDLASFFNTSPEEAVTAIGAALRGESEPIRRFGVLLNEATLKQKALELGLIKNTKQALTPQQKVLAAQAAIYEQTTDAQGDFARTSGGLANQQRILKAQLSNTVAQLGAKLLPIVTKIAIFFNEKLVPAIQNVIGWFSQKGFKGVLKFITDEALPKLRQKLIDFGKAFVEWIGPATQELLANLPEIIATILKWLLSEGIPKLLEIAGKMAVALAGFILMMLPHVISGLGQFVVNLVKELPGIFGALFEGMRKTGASLAGFIVEGLQLGFSLAVQGVTNSVKAILNGLISLFETGLNGFFSGVNRLIHALEWTNGPASYPRVPRIEIPRLADGGIVRATNGGTLALIGEGGRDEAVVPLGRGSSAFPMGGITINVSGALDPVSVARQIQQILNNQTARFGY